MPGDKDLAHITTIDATESRDRGPASRVPALTVLFHPDLARVGEIARLPALNVPMTIALLSRIDTEFAHPGSEMKRPLGDPVLSRRPIRFMMSEANRWAIFPAGGGSVVSVAGEPLVAERVLDRAALEAGVVIELARRFVLLFHLVGPARERGPRLGLVGDSDGVEDVREQIRRVAASEVPVLIRGESGAGKELVARAIHQASRRAAGAYVAVNMAAVPASVAASELFGHLRGAFTGAARDHRGYFEQAGGGSLFLDEVGDTPPEVQTMLLRVLETSEVQPLGASASRKVDVRLIAATEVDLEKASQAQAFRAPLLHRLSSYLIAVPPLRERRDDIGRLFVHFLRAELEAIGEVARLAPPADGASPWIPATLVARLARHEWPGNVRQLRNVVRQLVISSRGGGELRADASLEKLLAPAAASSAPPMSAPPPRVPAKRRPAEIDDEELVACLERNGWKTSAAAAELGISRTSLYALIERSPSVRKARDVSAEEIEACRHEHDDLDAMAEALRVSKRGLRLRMRELGMGPRTVQ